MFETRISLFEEGPLLFNLRRLPEHVNEIRINLEIEQFLNENLIRAMKKGIEVGNLFARDYPYIYEPKKEEMSKAYFRIEPIWNKIDTEERKNLARNLNLKTWFKAMENSSAENLDGLRRDLKDFLVHYDYLIKNIGNEIDINFYERIKDDIYRSGTALMRYPECVEYTRLLFVVPFGPEDSDPK